MTKVTEAPRIAAWKLILEQVEALQGKMQELGIQAVVDHYSTDDGIAGLQGAEFVNGCASRIHMPEHDFGEAPAMVSIRPDGAAEELVVHPFDGIVSMQDAATQIFENICEYIYATSDPDAVIDGFDLRIETTGGIEVHVLGATAERWNVPPVTTTCRQLEGWFEREIERLGEELTDRFLAVARQRAEEIARDYPGLELDIMAGHGTLLFRHTLNGRRVNYDDIPVEEIEKAYPGLSERLDEMEDVYARLQGTVAVGDFERIAMRPEPDAYLEPDPAGLEM